MAKTSDGEWDQRFMALAYQVATWSKDPDCRVGAVIVSPDRRRISVGYNGFVRDAEDSYLLLSVEEKLMLTVHAELNAILNAGTPVRGCTLYCTKFMCVACAKAIIQSGIDRVVADGYADPASGSKWARENLEAIRMMTLAGVAAFPRKADVDRGLPESARYL